MTTSNEEYEDMVDYSLEDVHDDDMESIRAAGVSPAPPPAAPAVLASLPSDAELKLTQRVIDLEQERNALASRVQELESRFQGHSSRIPAPLAPELSPATSDLDASVSSGTPIPIPPDLLPVLAILRQHIFELTRENAALRYTFLGSARPDLASSYKVTLDTVFTTPGSSVPNTPMPIESPPIGIEVTAPADPAPPPAGLGLTPIIPQVPLGGHGSTVSLAQDVDLHAVVERVKTLMLENEELGDMVAQAGQADGDEWVKTLEDTKAVIASLDSDLTHNLSVVETLRTEVDAYKARFGSLDGTSNGSGQTQPTAGRDRAPERGGAERGGDRGADRGGGERGGGGGGERSGGGAGRNDRRRNGTGGDGGGGSGGGGGGRGGGGGGGDRTDERYHGDRDRGHRGHGGDRDRAVSGRDNRDHRDRDNQRDNRDRDKHRTHDDRGGGGGRRDAGNTNTSSSGGLSILGRAGVAAAGGENGASRRDEDRASKRRR